MYLGRLARRVDKMTDFTDHYWESRDGLRLHYRDYAGREDRPPVLCLPGLTRNARDFDAVAARLCGEWRVICPDMRGRGDSAYAKDSATYNPMQYVDDVTLLLDSVGFDQVVIISTSLGGLMTMAMVMVTPQRIAGAVINDVGPQIEPAGLERIRDYVGQGRNFSTWMHAARALQEIQGVAFPGYEIADWLVAAKRTMTLGSNGRIVFDYDMKIAEPLATMDLVTQPDLWPGIEGLAGKPALFIRGELSDLLSAETLVKMQQRLPGSEAVTIARVGHAPSLGEPEAVAAIDRLLARIG
jgi:pimeloyl-ACP methyl ester carboxylesterase